MKSTIFPRKAYLITVFSALLVFATISSCEKEEIDITSPVDNTYPVSSVAKESLVKFLSITLGVEKAEIIYTSTNDEFIVRGHKFDRTETEDRYKNANVYHTTYGE